MSIAKRLREALEERDMSVREFQRRMEASPAKGEGTSYPAINRALQGKVIPSVPFLEAAAEVLGVRPAWLMAGDGHMTETPMAERRTLLKIAEYFAGHVPWPELAAWRDRVESLGLRPEEAGKVHDAATAIFDAIAALDIGNVIMASGHRTYRPDPELREAMRLGLEAWIKLLDQWIEEYGPEQVRDTIRANVALFEQRFVGVRPPPDVIFEPRVRSRLPRSRKSTENRKQR